MEYFITGIDTDIGKTFVTKGLAYAFYKKGLKTGVFKPLQSGALKTKSGLAAPDLEAVKAVSKDINTKCSYLLEGEVSPALAARLAGVKIDIDKIKSDFKNFKAENDITLVEGAGGLFAPASDTILFIDLIKELNIPVIIVTVPFLGRLNHTLMTIRCLETENIPIKGLIINKIPEHTEDKAVQNFEEELKIYTNTPVSGRVKDGSFDSACAAFNEIIRNISNFNYSSRIKL